MGRSSMTPCCRFPRSLVPLAALLSPSVAFYFFVYISIGLSFATPNRCNNISLFCAPIPFVILLIRRSSRHLFRPWEKNKQRIRGSITYLKPVRLQFMSQRFFPLGAWASQPSSITRATVPESRLPPVGGGSGRTSRAGKAKEGQKGEETEGGKRACGEGRMDGQTDETHATFVALKCRMRLSCFFFPLSFHSRRLN